MTNLLRRLSLVTLVSSAAIVDGGLTLGAGPRTEQAGPPGGILRFLVVAKPSTVPIGKPSTIDLEFRKQRRLP